MKKDSRLANNSCPVCDHKLDAATLPDSDKDQPAPGDYSCCIYCAAYLRFGDDMRMEHVPDEEVLDMEDENRLQITKMRRAITEMHNRDN